MFYGHYRSSSSGTTGCVKEFMTGQSEKMLFSPQVSYRCDLCNDSHGFRLYKIHQVQTPSASKQFNVMCEKLAIERDVEVPGM